MFYYIFNDINSHFFSLIFLSYLCKSRTFPLIDKFKFTIYLLFLFHISNFYFSLMYFISCTTHSFFNNFSILSHRCLHSLFYYFIELYFIIIPFSSVLALALLSNKGCGDKQTLNLLYCIYTSLCILLLIILLKIFL